MAATYVKFSVKPGPRVEELFDAAAKRATGGEFSTVLEEIGALLTEENLQRAASGERPQEIFKLSMKFTEKEKKALEAEGVEISTTAPTGYKAAFSPK